MSSVVSPSSSAEMPFLEKVQPTRFAFMQILFQFSRPRAVERENGLYRRSSWVQLYNAEILCVVIREKKNILSQFESKNAVQKSIDLLSLPWDPS